MFNIIGDIFGSSGYSVHTRNLANALSKIHEVRLSTQLPTGWQLQVSDRELDMIKREPKKDEINIIITNPLYWKLNYGLGRNWVYLVWEGDKVPQYIYDECLNKHIEYILVPSSHTRKALLNSGVIPIGKIKLIPHGVDLNLFYPKEKPKKCVFICNKGLRNIEDRGGIQYLLKAYIEEFTDEDVELIVKINPAYGIVDLNNLMKQMNIPDKKHGKITVNDQNMKYEDLVKLYNMGTVFVSPTRAEAFNIPCLEAMACGLPVLTTNFGGQTDYVNDVNGWFISGELSEVKGDIMYEEVKWLTPNIEELKKKLRHCYECTGEVISKGLMASKDARFLTWDNTSKLLSTLVALQSE